MAEAGDEIRLSPGTYKGNFELKPQVSLIGENTSTTVLMPDDGIAKPIITAADQCSIENLTITKALAGSQAAILLKNGSALVWHNMITGNLAPAIAVEGGPNVHPNIENNRILNNKGNGITVISASPTIKNNLINSNSKSGISATNSSPVIEGNQIRYNADTGISLMAAQAMDIQPQVIALQFTDLQPQIRGNQILDNLSVAVMCESVSPIITSNTLRSKAKPPLRLFNSSAVVRKNKFTTTGTPAVQIDGGGAPVIEENIMTGVRRFPVLGESKEAIIRNNKVEGEWSPGLGNADWLTKPATPAKPVSPTPGVLGSQRKTP